MRISRPLRTGGDPKTKDKTGGETPSRGGNADKQQERMSEEDRFEEPEEGGEEGKEFQTDTELRRLLNKVAQ
jgi:hypothetical protein